MLARQSMLDHALAYARKGWPVFPCNPKAGPTTEKRPLNERAKDASGKHINGTGGVSAATTDETQIRAWWSKWPSALVGIAMGRRSGVWAVDFDPRDGETVEEVEARFREVAGDLPAMGPRSVTPSGGWHIWFRMPPDEIPKNAAGKVKHIDWRGEGGYVIAPPSVLSDGRGYHWSISPDDAEFPDPPARLMDLVLKRGEFAPKKRAAPKPAQNHDATAVRRYCEVALARACDKVAALPDGQRNQGLNDVALSIGHLVGPGRLDMAEAEDALRQAAYTWGIGDDDKALKPGGTLERALADGAREPANLDHVTRRRQEVRRPDPDPEPVSDHDPETGEIIEVPPDVEPSGPDEDDRQNETESKLPFRPLGHNHGQYYYFSRNKQQITSLKAKEHTPLNLLQIANLNVWAEYCDTRGKLSAEQWTQVANSLIEGCHRAGIFNRSRVRGRGAWLDGKKVIVHTGDSARIDGEIVPLDDIPGRNIYEAAEPWEFEFGSPATTTEANRLAKICKNLSWQDPMSGALLAGWIVISTVCGALKWRPHIWITGPAGSGKSTVVDMIVGKVVGPAAERFEGNTTEAGIRQSMGFDARPIIMDEAESEDGKAVARMQEILGLARLGSSGGRVGKGSANGEAMKFEMRSCFMFSSINTAVRHHADESRITKLVLAKNEAASALKDFQDLERDIAATFTPEYAGAMFSRTVRYLPELLANTETFITAAAVLFGSRRAADQIGPMLAGYYLCHSTDRVTLAQAEEFLRRPQHDWTEHAALDSVGDEMKLFQYLMSRRVRVTVGGSNRELSIGQMIERCRDDDGGSIFQDALGPRGIRVDYDTITISNTADGVREMLRDTQWAGDWKRPLAMIPGADKVPSKYFAPGLISRGVSLPMGLLRG